MGKHSNASILSFTSVSTSEKPLLHSRSHRPSRPCSLFRSLQACLCLPSRSGPDSTKYCGPRRSYVRLPSSSDSSTCSLPARARRNPSPPIRTAFSSLGTSNAIHRHSAYDQVQPPPYDSHSTRRQPPTTLRSDLVLKPSVPSPQKHPQDLVVWSHSLVPASSSVAEKEKRESNSLSLPSPPEKCTNSEHLPDPSDARNTSLCGTPFPNSNIVDPPKSSVDTYESPPQYATPLCPSFASMTSNLPLMQRTHDLDSSAIASLVTADRALQDERKYAGPLWAPSCKSCGRPLGCAGAKNFCSPLRCLF
jgi:hypothetical protein